MQSSNFALIRDARVQVKQHIDSKKKNVAVITVSDKRGERYEHRFPNTSRVSKHLDIMTASDLQERLDHGTYLFVEDELVDFRDGYYNGFIHSDVVVDRFMDLLGFQYRKDLPLHRGSIRKRNSEASESNIILRREWSQNEINVQGYGEGAHFNSMMSFVWNPFVHTINAAYDLVRLICSNGMVGMTSFLNTKVPLFNRWEDHLDIASRQIQNKVASVVQSRIGYLAQHAASVGDCLLLEEHAYNRLISKQEEFTEQDRERLRALWEASSPSKHLAEVYKPIVFADKQIAAQLPSHLSMFDAFNLTTEMRTHTEPNAKSSDRALDRLSNGLLFDTEGNYELSAKRFAIVKADGAFGDPERAFFGQVQ